MRSYVAIFFLLLTGWFQLGADHATLPPQRDLCKLKGTVFIEKVADFADYRVFVEEVEAFADLKVYKEEAETFATEPGYWYFTDVRGFADFSIYIEDVKSFADFSIAYTEYRISAGCR